MFIDDCSRLRTSPIPYTPMIYFNSAEGVPLTTKKWPNILCLKNKCPVSHLTLFK